MSSKAIVFFLNLTKTFWKFKIITFNIPLFSFKNEIYQKCVFVGKFDVEFENF